MRNKIGFMLLNIFPAVGWKINCRAQGNTQPSWLTVRGQVSWAKGHLERCCRREGKEAGVRIADLGSELPSSAKVINMGGNIKRGKEDACWVSSLRYWLGRWESQWR